MIAPTALKEVIHPYVERRAEVQGNRPIIRGTRVLVSGLVQDYRRGRSVEEMLTDYPHLRPEQVYDALSFYHDHRAEIDEEIHSMSDIAAIMDAYPPTLLPAPREPA